MEGFTKKQARKVGERWDGVWGYTLYTKVGPGHVCNISFPGEMSGGRDGTMYVFVYNGAVHHTANAVLRAAHLSYSINKARSRMQGKAACDATCGRLVRPLQQPPAL